MATQNEEQDVFQPYYFDSFPQPQTIPSGWDLSEIFSAPGPFDLSQGAPASAKDSDDSAES